MNLKMVERGTSEVLGAFAMASMRLGKELLIAEGEVGEKAREEVAAVMKRAYWLHNQDRVTLGFRYEGSPIVVYDDGDLKCDGEEVDVEKYVPSTRPGGRPPHVFLKDAETSVFDLLGPEFNVVDFTVDGRLGKRFADAAKERGIPIKLIHLPDERHVRDVWESDVVLLRPDGLVGWRLPEEGEEMTTNGEVEDVLVIVVGGSR